MAFPSGLLNQEVVEDGIKRSLMWSQNQEQPGMVRKGRDWGSLTASILFGVKNVVFGNLPMN